VVTIYTTWRNIKNTLHCRTIVKGNVSYFLSLNLPIILCNKSILCSLEVRTHFLITINFQNLLVAGPSQRRPGFYPMPVCVRFMVNKMAQRGFSRVFCFFPQSLSFHHCSILIFIFILLSLEDKWENSGKFQATLRRFGKSGSFVAESIEISVIKGLTEQWCSDILEGQGVA
jgi:hypothetical protein